MVYQYKGYKELSWFCEKCGRQEVLSFNTGGEIIVVNFDPPLKVECCGNIEQFQFVAATISDGRIYIQS